MSSSSNLNKKNDDMNTWFSSLLNKELDKLKNMRSVRPNDPPEIDLYMDQILTFLNSHLKGENVHDDEKCLTKTMINNYTKRKLLPPPTNKKYSKNHAYLLTFIYYLKNVLTIEEIHSVVAPIIALFYEDEKDLSIEKIYTQVYELEASQLDLVACDIEKKVALSNEMFSYVDDDTKKEYLRLITTLTLLSFDICLKKNIVENIIHEFSTTMKDKIIEKK